MTDLIVGLIVVAIVGGAIAYIIREKKRGVKCVGCPDAPRCAAAKLAEAEGLEGFSCSGCHADNK